MARITVDSKCRLCRAEGMKLFLKNTRCFSAKCPIEKKGAVPPGMHGLKRMKKPTDYSLQLRSKQKAKRIYGILERQFHTIYDHAKRMTGQVGHNLLTLLELRLDNVVYKGGLGTSRSHSKQLITHGHILVNGKKVRVPSHRLRPNDVVALDPKIVKDSQDLRISDKDFIAPNWLGLDKSALGVTILSAPAAEDIKPDFDVNLIIEYYSR